MKDIPSIEELRKVCQPEWIAQVGRIGRRFSIYITKIFLYTPLSANQITILGVVIYIGGACLFVFGNPLLTLIAALVVRAAGILDLVDGEVARYRKTAGPEGKFLDSITDACISPCLFVFLTFGIYHNFHQLAVVILGCAALVSFMVRNTPVVHRDYMYGVMVARGQHSAKASQIKDSSARGLGRVVVKIYSPHRRLPRLLWRFMSHFHFVNFILLAAVIDLILYLVFPSVLEICSAMYILLILYATIGIIDAVLRVGYIVHEKRVAD